MFELEFFESSSVYGVIKGTIHKTGKLGFSSGAAKFINLPEVNYVNIGLNKSDSDDKCLYMVITSSKTDRSFKVVKAGDYYYVNVKNIMKELEIDYKNNNVIYDIEKLDYQGKIIYKMCRRDK